MPHRLVAVVLAPWLAPIALSTRASETVPVPTTLRIKSAFQAVLDASR